MNSLYRAGVGLYRLGIRLAIPFSEKAKAFVAGRKNWKEHPSLQEMSGRSPIWFHCASLGEFEQGRPVLESIRKHYPNLPIVLTFFSPSGFEAKKNFANADWVTYLPEDTPAQANHWITTLNPRLAIFVKYDFWLYHLKACKKNDIPVCFIACDFPKSHWLFHPLAQSLRNALRHQVRLFLVQNVATMNLLKAHGMPHVQVTGDPRVDRVWEILETKQPPSEIRAFSQNQALVVAGSTWPGDEEGLEFLLQHSKVKVIIAPHETSESRIAELMKRYESFGCQRLSQLRTTETERVLLIDRVGILSSLYGLAHLCWIGGGFGKGIHNTWEAAVYGKPIVFGPKFGRFPEAKSMIERGGASWANSPLETARMGLAILSSQEKQLYMGSANKAFAEESKGATIKIMKALTPFLEA
jgi:3-deoxy-D-manno-octulosonic-acid transferase